MKTTLIPGTSHTISILIDEKMQPSFDGKIIHPVYSTWSMAHHTEIAARRLLEPYLEQDEEGIGTHLSIDHIGPAFVGETITITATATMVKKTSLVSEIKAYVNSRLIGKGKQEQRVLPKEVLKKIFKKKSSKE